MAGGAIDVSGNDPLQLTNAIAHEHADSLAILVKYSKVDPEKLKGIKRATYATGLDFALIKPVRDIGLKYNVKLAS